MRMDFKEQTISVLVPCYNVEGTLGRCLDSIEGQTHDGIEIIAVNMFMAAESRIHLNMK